MTHTSICLETLRQTTKIFRTLYVLVGIRVGYFCSASRNWFYSSNLLSVDPAVCPFETNLTAVRKFVAYFLARSHNCKKRILASSCLPVCSYVCMEKRGPHWTDFHKLMCLIIWLFFKICLEISHVSLKSDKNNLCTFDNISLNSF
jgi:hypothetical protein